MKTANPRAQPLFRRYGNRDGHSGVVSYALAGTGIVVRFADGATYLYDRDCPGAAHVARMKALAQAGRGLATYISQRIGRRYRARLDAEAGALLPGRLHTTRQNTALR